MGENIFYRGISTKKHREEFFDGSRLAREKIASHPSAIKTAYRRAEKLSKEDLDSLTFSQRGYISKVVESKLRKKGGVLDAYNICLNTGVIHDIPNKEIEENLIKDAVNSNLKYMNSVKSFIDENKIAKTALLEIMVHEAGRKTGAFKKINKISIAMVLAGFLFSSYNVTGNVIGTIYSSGKLLGALLFSVGLIWMTVSMKKETTRFASIPK